MEWAEGTGTSLEEAQQNALSQLGVSAEEVQFEVLERPGPFSGILGRGQFKVRARLLGEEAAEPEAEGPDTEELGEPPHAELAENARQVLQRMVTLMGSDGEVAIAGYSDDEVTLNIEGEDLGLLIGRHGATLDAIQLIVAIAANRGIEDGARVIVDAEGYRDRHRQMLEARAHQHAEEAKTTGREVVIPDLKGYERRYMHMALKDDPEIETYSEGEGDDRVLVISPR